MTDFIMPTARDIEGTSKRVASKAPTVSSDGFKMPKVTDMGYDNVKKKLKVDMSGMTLRPLGMDTGIELPEQAANYLSGAGRTFAQIGRMGRQVSGIYPNEQMKNDMLLDAPLMDSGWATAGDITTNMALGSLLPVGSLSGGLGKMIAKTGAKSVGNAVGNSLITDAALSGALTSQLRPSSEDESRLGMAAEGAAGGAIGAALLKPLFGLAGKSVNAVRNKWGNARAQELDRIARENGIDLTLGDLPGNTGWRHFEDATEGVPLSHRTKNMEKQAGQMQDALYDLRENLRPNMEVADEAGNIVAKYGDANEMMVGEIQRNFTKLVEQKDALFDDVSKVIAQTPDAKPVDLKNTKAEVKKLIDSHPDIFESFKDIDSPVLARMKGLDDNLSQSTRVLDASGQPMKRDAKASYDDAQWLRKRLGALSEAARKKEKTGGITADAAGQLKLVYSAVNKDLDSWGAQPGNAAIHDAYKNAQKFYKENLIPFKTDPVLKKVTNEFAPYDTDKATQDFFKEGLKNRAETLMKFTTPEGQQAMQFALVDRIADKGLERDAVKIKAFLNEAKKLSAPSSKVFNPATAKQLDDLSEVLNAGKRAEGYLDGSGNQARYAAVQATRSLAPWLASGAGIAAGAGAVGGTPAGLVTGGLLASMLAGSNIANRMSANPTGKRILMADSALPGPLNSMARFLMARGSEPAVSAALNDGTAQQFFEFNNDEYDPMNE